MPLNTFSTTWSAWYPFSTSGVQDKAGEQNALELPRLGLGLKNCFAIFKLFREFLGECSRCNRFASDARSDSPKVQHPFPVALDYPEKFLRLLLDPQEVILGQYGVWIDRN